MPLRNKEANILCQPIYSIDLAFCVVELSSQGMEGMTAVGPRQKNDAIVQALELAQLNRRPTNTGLTPRKRRGGQKARGQLSAYSGGK